MGRAGPNQERNVMSRIRFAWKKHCHLFGKLFVVAWLMLTVSLGNDATGQGPKKNFHPEWMEAWYQLKADFRNALSPLRQPGFSITFLREGHENQHTPFRWEDMPPRVVLILGGLQSQSEATIQFATALKECSGARSECAYAVYNYPNDGPIEESGESLRLLLKQLSEKAPNAQVSIVAHSMGALVARSALELSNDEQQPQVSNVDRLIMVCPPNHGSVLAQYADPLELTELLDRFLNEGFSVDTLLDVLVHDGMGEACEDLVPGSPLLLRLESAKRSPGVRYSIAFGTEGPIDPTHQLLSSLLLEQVRPQVADQPKDLQWLFERGEELLHCDELTRGRGDGAVSCRSAKLQGAHEKAGFRIHHLQWLERDHPEVRRLMAWIAKRAVVSAGP
jgi:pimeloyl-ACP methyl ester carboxylesterase